MFYDLMDKKNQSKKESEQRLFSYQIEQILNSSDLSDDPAAGDISFISDPADENEFCNNHVFLIGPKNRSDPFADLRGPALFRSSSKNSADSGHNSGLTIEDSAIFRVTDLRPDPHQKTMEMIGEPRKINNKCNCM